MGPSLDQAWGAEQDRSEVIVELVVLSQVDPAEDERSQGQSQHHDKQGRASMALRGVRGGREGPPDRCSVPLLLDHPGRMVGGGCGFSGCRLTPPQTHRGTAAGLSVGGWHWPLWRSFLHQKGGEEEL